MEVSLRGHGFMSPGAALCPFTSGAAIRVRASAGAPLAGAALDGATLDDGRAGCPSRSI